jgi:hypothetical protein
LKSGSLNLLEPSGPVQACNEIAFLTRNFKTNTTYRAARSRIVEEHNISLHHYENLKFYLVTLISYSVSSHLLHP